jgi:hypothetical protein
MIFTENSALEHSVQLVHTTCAMLVDTGSTITTMGTNGELTLYIESSTSGINILAVTGQVVHLACEGNITHQVDQASLVIKCQHPTIGSEILSPAETCDTLGYDSYEVTCNRCT